MAAVTTPGFKGLKEDSDESDSEFTPLYDEDEIELVIFYFHLYPISASFSIDFVYNFLRKALALDLPRRPRSFF